MRKIALLLLLSAASAACPKPLPPTPPPGAPSCAGLCRHLIDLGCPEARPTPEGKTCAEVCENIVGSGVISWNLECRSRAASCAAADRCEVR